MEQSTSIESLAKALFKAQSEVGPVKRTTKNPFFNSMYADLSTVLEAIRKPLADNNLLLIQTPEIIDNKTGVTTTLYHIESNEWVKSSFSVSPKDPSNPQVLGSIITYIRRYAIPGIVMVASEDDDDGNSAADGKKEEKKEEVKTTSKQASKISEGQVKFIQTLFTKVGYKSDLDKYSYSKGVVNREVNSINDLTFEEADAIIKALRKLTTPS